MKKLFFLILLLSILKIEAFAQQNVEPIQSVKNANYGLIYSLPKTALELNVQIQKTVKKAGPYAKYAKKYFGLNPSEVIFSDEKSFEITSITINKKGIADPDRTYKITAKPKSLANLLQLNENGVICGINIPAETPKEILPTKTSSSNAALSFNKEGLGEDYFLADSAKMAEVAASQIYLLRESETGLSVGTSDNNPSDGTTLQLMLQEVKAKEGQLMELFTGKAETTVEQKTIELVPEKDINKETLFLFSATKGIVDKDDATGKPVYISLKMNKKEVPQTENSKKPSKNGIIYCLPGSADIEISDGKTILYKGNDAIAQFGTTLALPVKFLDKNRVKITFNTETGALKSLTR
jgi:hypothetical protein